jgi:NAD(P)-dependent dehydrogenase (short-subunit alcohol dehydrogenase family)
LKYALPELRKTKGRVTATTSGAGYSPLFSGWGFYGMSKAAVGFLIQQLALEERENGIVAVGISPGLCDTKMVAGLKDGTRQYHPRPCF